MPNRRKGEKKKAAVRQMAVVKVLSSAAKRKRNQLRRFKRIGRKQFKQAQAGLVVTGRVSAPVAKAASFRQRGPKVGKGKGYRIRHSELLQVFTSTGLTYDLFQYANQPGLDNGFPWLSQIAVAFKEYKFRRLRYRWEPNCSSATPGAMIMVPLYNADDQAPTSVRQALDMKNAVNIPIWQKGVIEFSGQKFMKNLFVRASTLSGSLLLYDFGSVVFIVDNVPATANIGKMFIEYDIDFFIPTRLASITAGYGSGMKNSSSFNTGTSDMFQLMKYDVTDAGQMLNAPPVPDGKDYTTYGGSDASVDISVGSNTIQFLEPNVYVVLFQALPTSSVSLNYWLNSIGTSGALVLRQGSTKSDTSIYVDHSGQWAGWWVVAAARIQAQMLFNWNGLSGGNWTTGANAAVLTVSSDTFFNQNEITLSTPVVVDEDTKRLFLKINPSYSRYFENPMVHVLSKIQFESYRKDGKIPTPSDVEVRRTVLRLQKELALVLRKPIGVKKEDEKTEIVDPAIVDRAEPRSPDLEDVDLVSDGSKGLVEN